MDLVKESSKLRKKIEKISTILKDGTALSEQQIQDLKEQRRQLIKQFDALLKKL